MPDEASESWDLHDHLVIIRGRLALVCVSDLGAVCRYTARRGGAWRDKNTAVEAALRDVASQCSHNECIFVDLGYVGSFLRDITACFQLTSTQSPVSALLMAVADLDMREEVDFFPGAQLSAERRGGPLAINADQLRALQTLRYNVAAIQGPPGTGKSMAVLYIVRLIMARRSQAATLASCVQVCSVVCSSAGRSLVQHEKELSCGRDGGRQLNKPAAVAWSLYGILYT